MEVEIVGRWVSLGLRELSVIERCLYHRGRADCTKFDISRTKETVRSREVSVL